MYTTWGAGVAVGDGGRDVAVGGAVVGVAKGELVADTASADVGDGGVGLAGGTVVVLQLASRTTSKSPGIDQTDRRIGALLERAYPSQATCRLQGSVVHGAGSTSRRWHQESGF